MNFGKVNFDINDGVATISFFHPKSNSLPSNILNQLANTIESIGNNPDVNVIILKSEGDKSFCAGASFDELIEIDNLEDGKNFFMGFANVINAIRKAPKFVIARVQGKAVGGGVGLAAAADYTLAHKDASIKLSEFALGLGPNVVGPAVERKIGTSRFAQISIDYEWYSAQWAYDNGLYANIFDTIEELDQNINNLAHKLSKSSQMAAAELKKIFWHNTEHWDKLLEERAEISGKLVLSEFTKNYIKQFKNK